MEINADFTKRVLVHSADEPWVASPMAGVDRRMLDRLGDEVARATSIVRYAPGSHFSAHTHTGEEEFLVIEGVFQDEHGDFPEGTYVRNPPTTSHTPGSEAGCTIFVKLWQFDMKDRNQFKVDTNSDEYAEVEGAAGVKRLVLHADYNEDVSVERWAPGAEVKLDAKEGLEALVLDGSFSEAGEAFSKHSWLRLPKGAASQAIAGDEGAKVWIKRNHLTEQPAPPNIG